MKKITITDATLRECARRGDIALSFKEKLEIARLYSSEIEYSDENVDILLDLLNEYNEK